MLATQLVPPVSFRPATWHSPCFPWSITDSYLSEGDYNRADSAVNSEEQSIGNDVSRDAQDVENAPANAARDVEDVPSDIGQGISGAASWIGNKLGGAENEGQQAENDVDQFDQGVDNSYNQGQQQGEQKGW